MLQSLPLGHTKRDPNSWNPHTLDAPLKTASLAALDRASSLVPVSSSLFVKINLIELCWVYRHKMLKVVFRKEIGACKAWGDPWERAAEKQSRSSLDGGEPPKA